MLIDVFTTKIPSKNQAIVGIATLENKNSGIKICFNLKHKILHYPCNHNICRLKIERIKANVFKLAAHNPVYICDRPKDKICSK